MTDVQELLDQIQQTAKQSLGDEPDPVGDGQSYYDMWIQHQRNCAEEAQQEALKLLAALRAVLEVHQKTGHQRAYGFPKADKWEHYCSEDNQTWPCPTVQAIITALGAANGENS